MSRRLMPGLLRAFSLLELIVSITVIAILIALALPVFGRVRDRSRELVCLARVRTFGQAMAAYAHDYRGEPPSLVNIDTPSLGFVVPTTVQQYHIFNSKAWLDHSGIVGRQERACPAAPRHYLDEFPSGNSDYLATGSLWLDPAFLDPALPKQVWRSMRGRRIQHLDSAVFPSLKVGVFEWRVWHQFRRGWARDMRVDDLFYSYARVDASKKPGTVYFLDGHAAVHSPRDVPFVSRPHLGGSPFSTTEHGMRGRDMPVVPQPR